MGLGLDSTCAAWQKTPRQLHVVVLGRVAWDVGVAQWCVNEGEFVRGHCSDSPCVAWQKTLRQQHWAVLCWGVLALGVAQWCVRVGGLRLREEMAAECRDLEE